MRPNGILLNRHERALTQARQQSDGVLLARLKQYGTAVQAATLKRYCRQSVSVREVWRRLAPPLPMLERATINEALFERNGKRGEGNRELQGSLEYFVCLRGLWERLSPDRPMFEATEDLIRKGKALARYADQCAVWWRAWESLTDAIRRWRLGSITVLDRRIQRRPTLWSWLHEFMSNLEEAGREDASFYRQLLHLTRDIPQYCQSSERMDLWTIEHKAKAHYWLAHWASGDDVIFSLLSEKPDWGDGWEIFCRSFLGYFASDESRYDPQKAERIAKKGLSIPELEDDVFLLERLVEAFEIQGKNREAQETEKVLRRLDREVEANYQAFLKGLHSENSDEDLAQ